MARTWTLKEDSVNTSIIHWYSTRCMFLILGINHQKLGLSLLTFQNMLSTTTFSYQSSAKLIDYLEYAVYMTIENPNNLAQVCPLNLATKITLGQQEVASTL